MSAGIHEMDPPLCGSALMSQNGSRSHHNYASTGASAMKKLKRSGHRYRKVRLSSQIPAA
jgi:hypothetical protein